MTEEQQAETVMTGRSNSKNPAVSEHSLFPNGPENDTDHGTCLALG